ncbi:MAG: RluA family pseudouridine synthase [Candidatus Sungiibacteriota bacterium]
MIEIIYSDDDMIVINKPPGISVHGGGSVSGLTVVDFLLEKFPEIAGVGEDSVRPAHPDEARQRRPGIVHRLDRDTSGVMVVARNQKSFFALKEIFQKRRAEKIYLAIVCGKPSKREGVIDFAIGRLASNPTLRGAATGRTVLRGARDALTEYRVLKSSTAYSLVELRPQTGRMHQLRVHMKAIGHPIACDTKYGGKKICCPAGAGRQLLHARSLSFSFPEGRRLSFEAEPPEDFSRALKILEQ